MVSSLDGISIRELGRFVPARVRVSSARSDGAAVAREERRGRTAAAALPGCCRQARCRRRQGRGEGARGRRPRLGRRSGRPPPRVGPPPAGDLTSGPWWPPLGAPRGAAPASERPGRRGRAADTGAGGGGWTHSRARPVLGYRRRGRGAPLRARLAPRGRRRGGPSPARVFPSTARHGGQQAWQRRSRSRQPQLPRPVLPDFLSRLLGGHVHRRGHSGHGGRLQPPALPARRVWRAGTQQRESDGEGAREVTRAARASGRVYSAEPTRACPYPHHPAPESSC